MLPAEAMGTNQTLMLHTEAMATIIFQSFITSVMGFTLHDFSTYDVTCRFISLYFWKRNFATYGVPYKSSSRMN